MQEITPLALMIVFSLLSSGCNTQYLRGKREIPQIQENMKTFDYEGIQIRYREYGEGEPVIFLHPFGGSIYTWRGVAPSISRKNKVILIDLKGFGFSDKPSDDRYSPKDQVEIIANFIKRKALRNVTLVGHSLGGGIALFTCLRFENQETYNPIKKLILIDAACYEQKLPDFISVLRMPFMKTIIPFLPSYLTTKAVLKEMFFDDSKITDEMINTYAYFRDLPGAHYALVRTAVQIIPQDIDKIVPQYRSIRTPTLIIWGKEDEIVPLKYGEQLKKEIPGAKLIVIPLCGHDPPEEKPLETTSIILDFLEED
jgi:pimeloyl-ACP methyl ester carboxylesterase